MAGTTVLPATPPFLSGSFAGRGVLADGLETRAPPAERALLVPERVHARWLALGSIVALGLGVGPGARAQEPSYVLAELALAPSLGLELGLLEGLELRGALPLEVELDRATGGVGASELGLLSGPLDDEDRRVSLLWNDVLPARSGVGDAVFEDDVEVIGHLSIDRLHAQVATGVEVRHGDVRAQGRTEAKIDLEIATAIWLHLDRVAIVLAGAGEPERGDLDWELGPTVLVQALEPLVLSAHAHATLGDAVARYEGVIGAIVDDRVFE